MKRLKTFFIYFLLIVGFYLFSSLMISCAINTRMDIISVDNKNPANMVATAKASGLDGIANVKVINPSSEEIGTKYIKINCYSKNNILQGTKYIETETIKANDNKEYEIRFNYTRVKKVEVELVNEIPANTSEENKKSDGNYNIGQLIGLLIVLIYI